MKFGLSRPDVIWLLASGWRSVLPGLTLLVSVLIAGAPGTQAAFPAASLLPVLVIFHWSVRSERAVAFTAVFGCGLVLDALSQGPLGYWALIYVATAQLAASVADFANGSRLARFFMLAVCLGAASLLQLVVLWAFGAELPPAGEVGFAMALAGAAYPAVAAVLRVATPAALIGSPHVYDPAGRP